MVRQISSPRFMLSNAIRLFCVGACVIGILTACGDVNGAPTDGTGALRSDLTTRDRLALDGRAVEITYDHGRNALWFVTQNGTGRDELLEYSIPSSSVQHYPLASDHANGIAMHVRVAPDGAVWVTDDYLVERVDVATGDVKSVRLAPEVNGARPDALNPSSFLPGTWISAIAFDNNGGVFIARHNVPFLQVFTTTMQQSGTLPLPSDLTGVADMAISSAGVRVMASYAGGASDNDAVRIIGLGLAGSQPSALRDPSGRATGGVYQLTDDGSKITFSPVSAQLVWQRPDGSTSTITFPTTGATRAAPNGRLRNVTVHDDVTAVTVDYSNTLWYVKTGPSGATLCSAS